MRTARLAAFDAVLERFAFPLALAGVMVFFGFEAGGYFAGTTGWVAVGLAFALGVIVALRGWPPEGFTRPLLVAAVSLALFAIWTLLSGEWSDTRARALIEFDRVLLYLLTLLLFASAPRSESTLQRLPAAVAFGAVILCGTGVLVRTLPDAWPFALPPLNKRLEYPLTYENAMGALAGLGLVFSLHLVGSPRRLPATRILAAASLPVLTAALMLTFSRGALIATVVGLVVYVVIGWSRGTFFALLATAPPCVAALIATYHADLLPTLRARTPAGLEQGEQLATVVGLAAVGAVLLVALLLPLERRLGRVALRGRARAVVIGLTVLAAAGAVVATNLPSRIGSLREDFLESEGGDRDAGARQRLTDTRVITDLSGQNRSKYWRVGLDAFADQPLRGHGAGTFARLWARDRPIVEEVTEGHSLYVEVLAELGVVGGLLLVVCLGTILVTLVRRLRGPPRQLYAAIVAAFLLWLVHAGVDWDWEMPVLTVWLFALGGCALAVSDRPIRLRIRRAWVPRALALVSCILVAVTPATVALSQARLDRSAAALRAGDCERAERWAKEAISSLAVRPEPYSILGYCAAGRGRTAQAVAWMQEALERDPESWELYYGLALVRAAGGRDPRPAARAAHRLNRREQLTNGALRRFSSDRPAVWRRNVRSAPLPLYAERLP